MNMMYVLETNLGHSERSSGGSKGCSRVDRQRLEVWWGGTSTAGQDLGGTPHFPIVHSSTDPTKPSDTRQGGHRVPASAVFHSS